MCFVFSKRSVPGEAYYFFTVEYWKFRHFLCEEAPPSANYLWFLDIEKVETLLRDDRFSHFRQLSPLLRAIDLFDLYKGTLDDVLKRICEDVDGLKDGWYVFVMYGVRTWDSLFTGQQGENKPDCLKWFGSYDTQRLKDAMLAARATTHSTVKSTADDETLAFLQKAYQDCMALAQRANCTSVNSFLSHASDIADKIMVLLSKEPDKQNAKRLRRN
ncbi:hypothetical protein CYMTET_6312 [Cymbomonas tetramitiformis]|uniref:Uncharacterized protein n=1 Tax=Cymbomonas tetramitiformis TaxID=36881 RepID=A0AAE0GXS9_9CHLO|nr:hypothetical protein CYMTET_6312 [Cymbomonas tetramitiformis]